MRDSVESRYLKGVYDLYHHQIDEHVGRPPIVVKRVKLAQVKLQQPKSYEGQEDVEKFESWLQSLLRWLKVNQVIGPDRKAECITYVCMFTKNQASAWCNEQVESLTRRQVRWTFKDVITRLYNQFVHISCMQIATEKYQTYKFGQADSVLGFYYELEQLAFRLV